MTINLTSTGWNENGNISIWTTKKDVVSNTNFNDVIGIELNSGEVVDTLAGDDALSGTGSDKGVAIDSGTLKTGSGNDIITGIVTGQYSYGIYNTGNIETGSGNDIITGIASQYSYGIYNTGNIDTGTGDDIIAASGGYIGIYNTGVGIGGIIATGDGDDTISGTGSDTGIAMYSGAIQTGNGNDIITGTCDIKGFAGLDNRATIDTGDGNDIINGVGGFAGILNSGGNIYTGNGKDIITGTGRDIGIFNGSTIDTGNGDDIITGTGNSMGIQNFGTINTGNGNDTIVSKINGGSQAVTIDGGGNIFMGAGDDYFQGFGNMHVYGDAGTGNTGKNDTLDLGSLTLKDFQSFGSISKIGTGDNFAQFTYNGTTMTTNEFDKFILAGTTYSYAGLTA